MDSNAIIIFQGDHGWSFEKFSNYDEVHIKSDIFNAIKAPKKCFKDLELQTYIV